MFNCPGIRPASENSWKQKPFSPGFLVRTGGQTRQTWTGLQNVFMWQPHGFATWKGEERLKYLLHRYPSCRRRPYDDETPVSQNLKCERGDLEGVRESASRVEINKLRSQK